MLDDPARTDKVGASVKLLNKLARILRQRRIDEGALTLASPEVRQQNVQRFSVRTARTECNVYYSTVQYSEVQYNTIDAVRECSAVCMCDVSCLYFIISFIDLRNIYL